MKLDHRDTRVVKKFLFPGIELLLDGKQEIYYEKVQLLKRDFYNSESHSHFWNECA